MIYVFLADGFEEIEALTVTDILRRAGKDVNTVGVGGKIITGSHKIPVTADITENDVKFDDSLEMIFLPGGMPGTINLEKSEIVNKAIKYCSDNERYIAAICAAPSILGHAGVLNGRKASCYPGFEGELKGADVSFDAVSVDGKIITSRGPATAIPLGLKLVELFSSEEISKKMGESLICM